MAVKCSKESHCRSFCYAFRATSPYANLRYIQPNKHNHRRPQHLPDISVSLLSAKFMRESFGSEIAQPAAIAAVSPTGPSGTTAHRVMLGCATLSAALICGVHMAFAGANTIPASGIGYLALTLVFFACSFAFWTRARKTDGALFIRWSMVSAAALTASIGYFPSFLQADFNTAPARQFQTACFNGSEALYLLAIVLFFAGVGRTIVIIDLLQAALFVLLRFHLIYSPITGDHFAASHLVVGQLMALFLFGAAMVGCLGASSRAELSFLQTLSWFFGLRFVSFFLANQVSYTWTQHHWCSLWDVPGVVLLFAFALHMLYTSRSAAAEGAQGVSLRPSITVRSMIPAFLALANLMLALLLLRGSFPLAAGAIAISLVCYMTRTVLLQAQTIREKHFLESRNEHLEGLAVRDPLTGIGNRRSLAQAYSGFEAQPVEQPLSLLLMDIDYFKQANDTHGHLYGDKVLMMLAKKLAQMAADTEGSHCSRFGGDEFAVLLVGLSPEDAVAHAENLRIRFAERALAPDGTRASLSIGIVSVLGAHEMPLETLISFADEALYRAKRLGRNRVAVQPASLPDRMRRKLSLVVMK